MLHDVGKCAIPKEILNKKGTLADEELEMIKKHPKAGFEILRKDPEILLLSTHCALQNHEKIDKSGYPQGLKGDEIHPYGKILAIADVYDALTSNRPYRKAMEVLNASTYTHFEPAFQQSVVTYPVGLRVQRNSRRHPL